MNKKTEKTGSKEFQKETQAEEKQICNFQQEVG